MILVKSVAIEAIVATVEPATGKGPAQRDLAVMDFHPDSKRMRLKSVHPGHTVEEVQAATGFELLLSEDGAPETQVPTQAQVRLIRDVIDPDGMRKRDLRRR